MTPHDAYTLKPTLLSLKDVVEGRIKVLESVPLYEITRKRMISELISEHEESKEESPIPRKKFRK